MIQLCDSEVITWMTVTRVLPIKVGGGSLAPALYLSSPPHPPDGVGSLFVFGRGKNWPHATDLRAFVSLVVSLVRKVLLRGTA